MVQRTTAQVIARICERHGTKRVFGVPGGGSSLDLIRAFAERGIPFVLTRTETGAALMAAATAEATGGLGVAITTQGPGTASAINGLAHAHLDRCPVLLVSDGWSERQRSFDTHQVFDQPALAAPLVRGSARLESDDPAEELEVLLALGRRDPCGPVYLELTGETARKPVEDSEATARASRGKPGAQDIAGVAALLSAAKRPVLVVGLEARSIDAGKRIAELATRFGCPVLTTYKAKGVVPDDHPNFVGLFTGGAAERDCVGSADLILLCGFDPVELIGRPWPYTAKVVDLGPVRHPVHYVEPAASAGGDVADILAALGQIEGGGGWEAGEIARLRRTMEARLAYRGSGEGLSPEQVVRLAWAESRTMDPRATVDAGAHMFSAMAFWPVSRRGDVLISNGLATMAYALPAGIAMSLETPERPVIAFTGDGGLMMAAGELSTAAQYGGRLCIVVFNDAALSLIDIKQQARQLPREGVSWPRPDLAAVAAGFGLRSFSAKTPEAYRAALAEALAGNTPSLIDVQVDPSGYPAQAAALRG